MIRQTKTENGLVRGIEAADPRITAFRGKILLCNPRRINDLIQYMRVDQKVLSKFFLKIKFIFL